MMYRRMAIVLCLVVLLVWHPAARAALCRTVQNRTVCLLDVKRSAKNYWEYRVQLSIDGKVRPTEVYNCRDRLRTKQDGTVEHFQPNDPENLVCSILG